VPVTTVFGIDVHADAELRLLGESSARSTGRALHMHVDAKDGDLRPPDGTGELLCDERKPNGEISFQIELRPDAGYLIWGPAYGFHALAPDGGRLRSSAGDGSEWQRLLVAQVLPFATLLHGLEVFHASAVVLEEAAIAVIGPSGSGKTSLALELCRLGAGFLADDVLALEVRDRELLGHPGTPVAGVDRGEARRLQENGAWERVVLEENARELLVRMTTVPAPVPIETLLFLDRRADGPSTPRFEAVLDPKLLLSATFNFVHNGASRLHGLLDVCSLAAERRVERVVVGPAVDVEQLAEAVMQRVVLASQ
jgi:hypothetical protein